MLPKRLTCVLTFFDIFGYNSGSTPLSRCYKNSYFISSLHILLALFFTVFKAYVVIRLRTIVRLVEIVNQMLQYSTGLFTYWLIILDSIVYRREHLHFWKFLGKINQLFSSEDRISLQKYALRCIIYFFIIISSFIASATQQESIFFVIFSLVKICEVRMLYYVFCIEVIQFQLRIIENGTKKHGLNRNIEVHRLKWLREYFHCIHEMVNLLNEIFGYSHFSSVSYVFYLALTDLNWLCTHFQELGLELALSKYDF